MWNCSSTGITIYVLQLWVNMVFILQILLMLSAHMDIQTTLETSAFSLMHSL